jgi:beta-exotoxin I transport system permease protein
MNTIFHHMLKRLRGQIIGWGLAMFFLSVLSAARYGFIRDSQEDLQKMMKGPMKEVAALFGDTAKLFTPEGFLSMQLFNFLPVILGVFVVLTGSGLLASDEESGILDLVLAHPISRAQLFFGRWLAFAASIAAVLSISWLGLVVAKLLSPALDIGSAALILPYVSLFALLLLFGSLALLLSMLLPSRRMSAMAGGLVVVFSFFLTMFGRVDTGVKKAAQMLPLEYYQSGEAIRGLNGVWLAGLLTVAFLFAALAWWQFEQRDIRVAGEGVWRWRFRLRRTAKS